MIKHVLACMLTLFIDAAAAVQGLPYGCEAEVSVLKRGSSFTDFVACIKKGNSEYECM